jgi:hypothetical protein
MHRGRRARAAPDTIGGSQMNHSFQKTAIAAVVALVFGTCATLAAAQSTGATGAASDTGSSATTGAATTTGAGAPAGTGATTGSTGAAAGTGSAMGAPGASTANATSPSTPGAAGTASPSAGTGNDQARRVFDQLDTNKDGMLSFDEFSRAVIQRSQ